jgi:acylphosphatase
MKKQVKLKINGIVQGVWYRASTKRVADELGLTGWVKNNFDGSVSVLSEGDEEVLKELIKWCWQGPPRARVDTIEEEWSDFTGKYRSFEVKY